MNNYLKLSSLLFNNNSTKSLLSLSSNKPVLKILTNSLYSFQISEKAHKNTRVSRPKVSKNLSIPLTYEQSQFVDKIGVTKSWNSWNTSNLLDGKRTAETTFDDIFIRKFIYATFHDLLGSEIIIKRRFNQISIEFLILRRKKLYSRQIYFLIGYSEELLSALLKCTVKLEFQTVDRRSDLIFRHW